MTLKQLNKLVRDTVLATVNNPGEVIVHYPDAPRPDDRFVTVNIAELTLDGHTEKKFRDDGLDIIETVIPMYSALISLNFYEDDARQRAGEFSSSLRTQEVIDFWNKAEAGLQGISPVRDLSTLFGAKREERAQMDVNVHFELTPVETVIPSIDVVRILGKFDNGHKVVDELDITIGG